MDITAWLLSLGMQRYAAAFRDHEIDWEALPKLTAEDLKDLGVVLGGHRRKLLKAIAALCSEPAPAAAPAAERRQLTVMFSDLVGSTEIAARLDPEDLREVIAAYHRAVAETAAGLEGFVAKYMGDGVLVYFGYPRAHENDAEHAVRAGLGVIEAVGRLDVRSGKLQARIGIATGLVVVADQVADHHKPGGDADPRLQPERSEIEAADGLDDPEARPDRVLGVVFVGARIAEIDQHPVAHVFGDKTFQPGDDFGDGAVIGGDDLAQILRVEPRGELGGAD